MPPSPGRDWGAEGGGGGREPHLKLVHLWGVAVGAAIGGDFIGWNATLVSGLGGALIGLGISTTLYLTLSLCIAEMSAHTLRTGASHTFVAESPLGRLGAYLCGVAELLKMIPTGAVCVFAIASYVGHSLTILGNEEGAFEMIIWVVSYLIFTLLNVIGIELSVNFQVTITVMSIALLVSFYMPALTALDFDKYALQDLGQDGWFLGDISTFWISLPYSLWWYLGIESVPLLAGSVRNPARVMPQAIIISMASLAAVAILTLLLNSSVAPGVVALQKSNAPLLDGFKALTSNAPLLMIVSSLVTLGLIVSFHCFVLYAGETVAVLSNDGILPEWLGTTHPRFGTPHVALLASSLLGLGLLALTVTAMAGPKAVSVLINVAVVGGLVAYILQFLAYLSRPWASSGSGFKSPLGRLGAFVGLAICVMLLGCEFYHATVEVTEAEGMLAATSVFIVALIVYYIGPEYLSRGEGLERKRTNSQAMQLQDDRAILAMDMTMFYEEDALTPGGGGSLSAISSFSPQRRRPAGGGGGGGGGADISNNSSSTGTTAGNGRESTPPSSLWCDV